MIKTKAVWFRNDLRVDDHPALDAACQHDKHPVRALVIVSENQWQQHQVGSNARAAWLQALSQLAKKLSLLNVPLDVLTVESWQEIPQQIHFWCQTHAVDELHFNIEVPFDERERDLAVCKQLKDSVSVIRHSADMLVGPWQIVNNQGNPFRVFTPFSKRIREALAESFANNRFLTSAPKKREKHAQPEPDQQALTRFLSAYPYRSPLVVTEDDARTRLKNFLEQAVADYEKTRDFPAIEGTSGLSAALAVGAISVRRAYSDAMMFQQERALKWTSELIWRDFYRYLLWHFPILSQAKSFRFEVERHIRWNQNEELFERWCHGSTGIPIIDAAMRQLNQTGWMHNRLRMVVASFLTKNLWQDWRKGEAWFASQLADYDFASNNGGWQWSASVGTDAAPYFRVFNPASQQKKFDPDATFIKRWVPELSDYSAKTIHQFESQMFTGYPRPMVDLKLSRKIAIECFEQALRQSRVSV